MLLIIKKSDIHFNLVGDDDDDDDDGCFARKHISMSVQGDTLY